MPDIKLAKIPERTPIKMMVLLPPEVAGSLQEYAAVYEREYGGAEEVQTLIPYMLANFLENDRGFQQARRKLASNEEANKAPNSPK